MLRTVFVLAALAAACAHAASYTALLPTGGVQCEVRIEYTLSEAEMNTTFIAFYRDNGLVDCPTEWSDAFYPTDYVNQPSQAVFLSAGTYTTALFTRSDRMFWTEPIGLTTLTVACPDYYLNNVKFVRDDAQLAQLEKIRAPRLQLFRVSSGRQITVVADAVNPDANVELVFQSSTLTTTWHHPPRWHTNGQGLRQVDSEQVLHTWKASGAVGQRWTVGLHPRPGTYYVRAVAPQRNGVNGPVELARSSLFIKLSEAELLAYHAMPIGPNRFIEAYFEILFPFAEFNDYLFLCQLSEIADVEQDLLHILHKEGDGGRTRVWVNAVFNASWGAPGVYDDDENWNWKTQLLPNAVRQRGNFILLEDPFVDSNSDGFDETDKDSDGNPMPDLDSDGAPGVDADSDGRPDNEPQVPSQVVRSEAIALPRLAVIADMEQ